MHYIVRERRTVMKKNEIRVELLRIERDRKNLMMPYLAALGLTFGQGQARILDTLLTKDHITQKKLADICYMDVATVSRSLDRLEEAGFLVRERDPECRRSFLICLTEQGKIEAAKAREGLKKLDNVICRGLSDDELNALHSVLVKISDNLEECREL